MNIEDNAANTAQNQGFCSIAEIEEYKSRVKEDIQDDEAKIALFIRDESNSLFHPNLCLTHSIVNQRNNQSIPEIIKLIMSKINSIFIHKSPSYEIQLPSLYT